MSSLATLWPRPKLSRPIEYSSLETQKFGLFSNGRYMACGCLYKLESYMRRHTDITTITVVPLWAKSGLRSNLNLRASNLQNFSWGAYPHIPLACTCLHMHTNHSPPPSQMFSAAATIEMGIITQLFGESAVES